MIKSRDGKSQRREEERRSKKRKPQKKEDPGARKGRKAAKHGVFPMICGSGGSKSRLAKAAGAELAGQMRDEKIARRCGAKHVSKSKCTKHTMFGSCDVEKVHAVVARSTVPSQNVQSTPGSDHVWKLRWWNSARRCGAKHVSKSKVFIRAVRRSGRWFPERGCVLEHQIFSFGKMILRDRCSTSYDLASLFRGRRNTLDGWSGKIAKRIGTRPSALHSTFHFWRMSRRIASRGHNRLVAFLCGRHPQNIGHFFIRVQRWQVWVAMRGYARRRKRLCWDHFAWHVCRASVASASIAGRRNLWILCAKGAANRIGTVTFTVASDVGFWVSLCRVAGFETACATCSSLCVVSLSLWRAANYDIARATLLSLCACWIALAAGGPALIFADSQRSFCEDLA